MRKTLMAISFAAVLVSCHDKNNTDESISDAKSDSLKSENATVLNNEMNLNGTPDTLVTSDGSKYVKVDAEKPKPVVVVNKTVVYKTQPITRNSTGTQQDNEPTYSPSEDNNAEAPVTSEKRGWSKAAKGTAIGAGTGAVAGAIISKNKAAGAVIGGVVGAGGGYIIGKELDKKDERKKQ